MPEAQVKTVIEAFAAAFVSTTSDDDAAAES
jgi:hypothetical protein